MKIFKDNMANTNQQLLLPPCVDDFVSEDSPARIMGEIVDKMNLDELISKYHGGGAPAYRPDIMLKTIVLGYCLGIRSSRKLAECLKYDVRFMFVSNMSKPDFRTIAKFRRDNLDAIKLAFAETVCMSQKMGLVLLEHVSVDGTKLEANVSRKEMCNIKNVDKSMELLEKKIAIILDEAEKVDAEEDRLYGDLSGDEVPDEIKKLSDRKKRLEAAKEEMERTGRTSMGATDLESRIMKTTSGKRPGYNAQAVVDKEHQVIIAADVTQSENDYGELISMLEQAENNTGKKPEKISADSGYYSQDNLQYAKDKGLDVYIPEPTKSKVEFKYNSERDEFICPAGKALRYRRKTYNKNKKLYRVYRGTECKGCAKSGECQRVRRGHKDLYICADGELREEMQKKMSSQEGKLLYRLRSVIVEPVFGDIKFNMKMVKLLLRGLAGAKIEYFLGCIAHNIKKIMSFWRGWIKNMAPA